MWCFLSRSRGQAQSDQISAIKRRMAVKVAQYVAQDEAALPRINGATREDPVQFDDGAASGKNVEPENDDLVRIKRPTRIWEEEKELFNLDTDEWTKIFEEAGGWRSSGQARQKLADKD